MEEINNFQQEPDETLYQAWEHFKELLLKCPQHYLTKTQEVICSTMGWTFQHDRFQTQEVPFQLRLRQMPKQPSKKLLNSLKNGIMEHLEEEEKNQGDDLMPTIKEGEVIKEFRTRDEDLDTGIDNYPSYCDDDKKIHIDCAHNLKFSCMIGFEFAHVNFYPLLYVNVLLKEFHNSIMKDKMVYKGDNVVEALINVPIFVGTFSVMTNFAVLEDIDAYRDEGMGDIIVGEPFLREVGIKTKRFKGIISLYNGDDEVTYQMVRSHPRPIRRIHRRRYGVSVPAPSTDQMRRHFKTLSLDELRSPDFNLLSDQEYSEEEEAEAMAETMEQYMSKTRTDYGSGVARPKIDNKDQFELKGQFLKELRENTFSGSDNEDANEHIEKVLEIVDLYHVPNITEDQLMLQVFPISLTGAVSRWLRNKPTGSIKTWEDLITKFLNKYFPPGRTAKKIEEINNFQQESDETLYQAWECFKELLMKCPQYYSTEMHEVICSTMGLMFQHDRFLTQEKQFQLRQLKMLKRSSKKWQNTLKSGIMEHLEEEVLRLLMDWLLYKHNWTI
ncbi:retrovirus-related pol polyprotein from transposon TNT 1-94 [Tanacetum coccineum]